MQRGHEIDKKCFKSVIMKDLDYLQLSPVVASEKKQSITILEFFAIAVNGFIQTVKFLITSTGLNGLTMRLLMEYH